MLPCCLCISKVCGSHYISCTDTVHDKSDYFSTALQWMLWSMAASHMHACIHSCWLWWLSCSSLCMDWEALQCDHHWMSSFWVHLASQMHWNKMGWIPRELHSESRFVAHSDLGAYACWWIGFHPHYYLIEALMPALWLLFDSLHMCENDSASNSYLLQKCNVIILSCFSHGSSQGQQIQVSHVTMFSFSVAYEYSCISSPYPLNQWISFA